MTNVKMKAVDTLHVSSVSQHSMVAGTEFEVPTHIADDLEARGLADRVADEPEKKAAPAPANKMDRAPANKAAK
jgi:hypothetical protein